MRLVRIDATLVPIIIRNNETRQQVLIFNAEYLIIFIAALS